MLEETSEKIFCLSLDTGKQSGNPLLGQITKWSKKTIKVATHEGTNTCDQFRQKVPWRVYIHKRTGLRDLSYEQFTQSVSRNKSQWLVLQIQTGLNSCDQSQGPTFSPWNWILNQKWPVHMMGLDATRCRNYSQGLVPSCVPTFKEYSK